MSFLETPPLVELSALHTFAQGLDHAEGICMTPDGTLYVSGEAGQIYRLEADDTASQQVTTGGWTLGLASDAAGRIYACDAAKQSVFRWDPSTGSLDVLSKGPADRPFVCPNWGAFGPDGTYYVTDSGTWKGRDGSVVRIRPGRPAEVWTTDSADFPNGLAVSPDGSELWVLESTPGRLVKFAIRPDGSAGPRQVVADLEGTVPDGIAFATDGSAVIACYRPDVVLRWRADLGVQVLAIDPEGVALAAPTNCVFSGADLATIVVPNIGRWHVTRFKAPGLRGVPLFYPTRDALRG